MTGIIERWGCKGDPFFSICVIHTCVHARVSGGTHIAHSPIEYPVDVEVKVEQQLFETAPRDAEYSAFVIGHCCVGYRPADTASLHFGGAHRRVRMLTGRTPRVPLLPGRPTDRLPALLEQSESRISAALAVAPSPPRSAGVCIMHVYHVDARVVLTLHWLSCDRQE